MKIKLRIWYTHWFPQFGYIVLLVPLHVHHSESLFRIGRYSFNSSLQRKIHCYIPNPGGFGPGWCLGYRERWCAGCHEVDSHSSWWRAGRQSVEERWGMLGCEDEDGDTRSLRGWCPLWWDKACLKDIWWFGVVSMSVINWIGVLRKAARAELEAWHYHSNWSLTKLRSPTSSP